MEVTFVEIANRKFNFLTKEFGFRVISRTESPRGERWEGSLEYATDKTYIQIACTRNEWPTLEIGRLQDNKEYLVGVDVIHLYNKTSTDEKMVLTSQEIDKTTKNKVSQILRAKHILNTISRSGDNATRMDAILSIYAANLREYAGDFLKGNFSNWLDVFSFQLEMTRGDYIRSGKDEFALHML
ncbi:MAG: hypothetical protein P8Z41_14500 [Anaerolineales bacterium]